MRGPLRGISFSLSLSLSVAQTPNSFLFHAVRVHVGTHFERESDKSP